MPRACDNRLCYSPLKFNANTGRLRRRERAAWALLLSATAAALPASAASRTYNAATGQWSTAASWGGTVPGASDLATLGPNSFGNVIVTYDGSALASNTAITQLTIEALAAGSITFSQTANTLAISNSEFIGSTGKGIWKMSGGAQNVAAGFSLGDGIGSSGTGTLSGGTLNVGFEEYIGNFGTGFYTQSGGSNTTFYLGIGWSASGTNVGSGVYNQTGGYLNATSAEYVGLVGNGVMNQSGGTNVAASLVIGGNAGANGSFNMSNGASVAVTNALQVGNSGNGTFNQTGGDVTATAALVLAVNPGATGTVNFSGGTLTAAGVNVNNNSIFTQSGGSLLTITGTNNLTIGNSTPTATYVMNGGTMSVAGSTIIGTTGNGVYTQTGGSHLISGTGSNGFILGLNAGANGTATFSGSGFLNATNQVVVGYNGSGTFIQSGGTNLTTNLFLGYGLSGSGVYNQTGGSLTVTQVAYIGNTGTGVYNQSGGTATIPDLRLGVSFNGAGPSSFGTYALSNGASLSSVNEYIGVNGNGVFSQTGGTNSTSYIGIGQNSNGTNTLSVGVYNLLGGVLTTFSENVGFNGNGTLNQSNSINNANFLDVGHGSNIAGIPNLGVLNVSNGATINMTGGSVGYLGNGILNMSGGTFNVGVAGTGVPGLFLGHESNSSGTVNLSGGLIHIIAGFVDVGDLGSGTFNQSGGTVSVDAANLVVGTLAGSTGVYNLSGTGLLTVPNSTLVGNAGNAVFNQSGGTHTVGTLDVGSNGGILGIYNLSGTGTLTATGTEYVGYFGNGLLTQSGGIHTAPNIYIGSNAGANGTVILSGSANLIVPDQELVGFTGTGTFTQNGGTNTTATLTLGANALGTNVGSGVYTMNAGVLTASSTEFIGYIGTGVLTQNGGTNTTSYLYVGTEPNGTNAASSGTINMAGGTLAVQQNETLGYYGTAAVNQTGGTHTVTPTSGTTLTLGYLAGSSGTYTLSAGSLTVAANEVVGYYGTGTFMQNGGTHTVNGVLTIGLFSDATASYALAGGQLNANVLNNGSFTQTFGNYTGSFTNSGSYRYNQGYNFNGPFNQTSSGTLYANITMTLPAGLTNAGTVNVPANSGIVVNGPGIDNEGGVINLAAGAVSGFGPIINNGSIAGYGTIAGSGGFTNNASIVQGAGNLTLSNSGVTLNAGNIALSSGHQLQLLSPLMNLGTLNLNGAVVSGTSTLINLTGALVSGPGFFSAPLLNNGTLSSPQGTLNVAQSFSNAGLIQLAGAGANFIGGAITNLGTVQGLGTLSNPIVNLGTVEPIGGTLVLAGAVQNPAAGLLRISAGNKLLIQSGLATNFGTVDLAGGTFDNGGRPLNNQGEISGYGTLATGGLTNGSNQTFVFSGGLTTINGPVTNTGSIKANYSPVIFTGSVVNNGVIKVNGAPTNAVTFAGSYSGSGQYLSDPAANFFQDVSVFPGGLISGAVGDAFYISGTYTNAGTYSDAGGMLFAQSVFNNGQFNQTAGSASLVSLTGTGSLTVGGAGTAMVTVGSLSQSLVGVTTGGRLAIGTATGTPIPWGSNAEGFTPAPTVTPGANIGTLTIANNAVVSFATTVGSGNPYVSPFTGTLPTNRITHQIGSLVLPYATGGSANAFKGGGDGTGTITPAGTLDIGNHQVLLNTPSLSDVNNVQLLVAAGYNASNYGNEDGKWNGTGITSSIAKSSYVANAGVSKYAVGYAYGSDASVKAEQGGGADGTNGSLDGIGANQTLVRAVLLGDVNMDGVVDFADISSILGYHYNDGKPAHYTDGDISNHGIVNFDDISLVLAFNYNNNQVFPAQSAAQAQSKLTAIQSAPAKTASAATLTGRGAAATAAPSISSIGTTGDGAPDFVYNSSTGDVTLILDGLIPTDNDGNPTFVGAVQLNSVNGLFITTPSGTVHSAGWTGKTISSVKITGALTDDPGFANGVDTFSYDLGNILPTNMSISTLTSDFTVKYQLVNGGHLITSDIVVTPEPTSLALVGLGAVGLLGRRRKIKVK